MELERLFRETDHDMILVDSPVVVAHEGQTRVFPYKICGAVYCSGTQLERRIETYDANERRYCCSHCQKEFRKDNNKLFK